ncbi:tetratricopeptide repeat protein [soil metagenome]
MPLPPAIAAPIQAALSAQRWAQARTLAQQAIRLRPEEPDGYDFLRTALVGLGDFNAAAAPARRVAEMCADQAPVLAALGFVLVHVPGAQDEAVAALGRALELDSTFPANHIEYITSLIHRGRLTEAESRARAALERFGPLEQLVFRLVVALSEQGRSEEAAAVLGTALFQNPASVEFAVTLCAMSNYAADLTVEQVTARHRNFGRLADQYLIPEMAAPRVHARPARGVAPAGMAAPGRGVDGRVRIGIVSADLRAHSVAWFAPALLEHLDAARVEVTVFSTTPYPDATTTRLKAMTTARGGAWRAAPRTDGAPLAALIERERIDVLLDLNGLTEDGCWRTMMRRPAPVQVTYCGYPATTGLSTVDWRIVDSITDPPGPGVERACTERLLRLDPCFLCYAPPDAADVPLPMRDGTPGRAVTFGSFNRLLKVSPPTIAAWARLLREVEGSRLILKSGTLSDPAVAKFVGERFEREGAGIDPARVEVRTAARGMAAHLAQYAEIDIALDTFPYAGTTTTCEALFMGTPVITLARPWSAGGRHSERVGATLLHSVGTPELSAESPEEYVARAAALARDATRRAEYHRTLRARLLASPLCAASGFGARMTGALIQAWNAWCAGASK